MRPHEPISKYLLTSAIAAGLLASPIHASANPRQTTEGQLPTATPAKPVFEDDGTVQVPAFELPPSEFLSTEALAQQAARGAMPSGAPRPDLDIALVRQGLERALAPQVARMREVFPVDVEATRIADVPVRIVTPRGRTPDSERILINLHGGAFSVCAEACAMLESVPISALGDFKVVTVDYRMAPEHRHPAGAEDAVAVYRELLRTYEPDQIGVYGCSAGGALSAQLAAWLPTFGLPQMGAVGIFGAGAVRFGKGDSSYVAAYIDGAFPPPARGQGGDRRGGLNRGYFEGVAPGDPIVEPALNPEIMAQFPPAMIVTGTRAMDLSPAVVTNSALIKAGVDSTLIVGEGMGHCYIYSPDLPEARDAQQAIVDFFREELGR